MENKTNKWKRFSLLVFCMISSLCIFAQSPKITVSGVVKDALGEPLIGATVVEKGTTNGAVIDLDGRFTLKVDASSILIISFIGHITQEVAVNGKATFNIILKEDNKILDEVIVVGYGSLKKSSIATSVASLKPEDFNKGGARDPLSLLEGKIAGLTVTRTGGTNPNSGVAYQLRGVTSLQGNTSPLVVVDGIPDGNLDLIQPEDIESIEVLKDGAAASIYGSRANAGVILVTTKKGVRGTNRVEYSTFMTKHFVNKRADFLNADEYRAYAKESGREGSMIDYGHSSDLFDALINKDNFSHSHNLAISGGSEATDYRASIFYNEYEGIGKSNSRQNYGGRVSLNTKAIDNMLTVQVNMATNYNYANMLGGGGWESANSFNPTLELREEVKKMNNPLNRLSQEKNKRNQQTTSLSSKIGLEPIKDLRFSIFGSILRNNYTDSEYRNVDAWGSLEDEDGYLGWAKKKSEINTKGAVEPTVEYTVDLYEKHSINAVGGYSYQYNVTERHEVENKGFINDAVQENNIGAGAWLTAGKAKMSSFKEDDTLIAFFGRVNYSYDSRYVAQVSLRREGSSKFGANNKWGNFPSYSVAWNASNEEFMKQFTFVSMLKARVGYGVTGNSGIPRYKSFVKLGTGGFYLTPDGDWVQSYGPSSNANADLKWETKEELNFGLDFGFLNNRLGGSLDIFSRTTKDLIENYDTQQPPFIFNDIFMNVGDATSKGVELTLNAIPVVSKDFMWKTDLTMSHANNKIKSFSNQLYTMERKSYGEIGGAGALGDAILTYAGDRIGNFYGKRFAGFTDEGKWLFYNSENEKVTADKIDNGKDLTVIGNGVPKLYLTLSNTFMYKSFDLTLMFRGKFGFDVLNRMEMAYGNKVTLPNNVLKSAVTRHNELNDTYQYSDYYIEKGDFVKLDNLTVGYNFVNKTGNNKIPSFRVYITGRDLITFTGYKGIDPEVKDVGMDPGLDSRDAHPSTRSFTLGLNVKF